MNQRRWRETINVAIIVSLVLALVAIGLGIAALRKTPKVSAGGGPVTTLIAPSTGKVVSGIQGLDAKAISTGVVAVDFVATGGALHDAKVGSGRSSYVGWAAKWDTRTVANGTYSLMSVSYNAQGESSQSSNVVVTVRN